MTIALRRKSLSRVLRDTRARIDALQQKHRTDFSSGHLSIGAGTAATRRAHWSRLQAAIIPIERDDGTAITQHAWNDVAEDVQSLLDSLPTNGTTPNFLYHEN